MTDRTNLIKSNGAFHLELTAAELKLTHTALKTLLDGFGREESDVKQIVQDVLAKLPPDHEISAIDIHRERTNKGSQIY